MKTKTFNTKQDLGWYFLPDSSADKRKQAWQKKWDAVLLGVRSRQKITKAKSILQS